MLTILLIKNEKRCFNYENEYYKCSNKCKDKEEATNIIKDLLKALEEGEQIIEDLESGKRKGYHNVRQMVNDILVDFSMN